MRYLISAAVLLAFVACGGGDGGGAGGTGGASGTDDRTELGPGVWQLTDGSICVEYQPNPVSEPDRIETVCVDEDWGPGICWRTLDGKASCDALRTGCVSLETVPAYGVQLGDVSWGCSVEAECLPRFVDNPECCGDHRGHRSGWSCGD